MVRSTPLYQQMWLQGAWDISDLTYVVNYDMPGIPEDYIHRIGRTGRVAVNSIVVSLVSNDETKHLQTIEKLLKQKIPVENGI